MAGTRISRTALETYVQCARCYYREYVQGIRRPSGIVPRLNLAADAILKREFDAYRLRQEPHPVMQAYRVDAVPFQHPDLDRWREAARGLGCTLHDREIYGAIDDVWTYRDGTLAVVDYKATAVTDPVGEVVGERAANMRQLEVYSWILHQRGFAVADHGYLVVANGDREAPTMAPTWPISLTVVRLPLDWSWVPEAIESLLTIESRNTPPKAAPQCEWCSFIDAVALGAAR